MAQSPADDSPSMEDILNTIRGVIAGEDDGEASSQKKNTAPEPAKKEQSQVKAEETSKPMPDAQAQDKENTSVGSSPEDEDEDVLELTDMIEDGEAMPEAPAPAPESEDNISEGLLDDIDNMIDSEIEEPQAEAPAQEAPAQEAPAEEEVMQQPEPAAAPAPEPVAAEPQAPASKAEPEIEAEGMIEAEAPAKDRLVSEATAATSQAVLKEMMSAIPRQKISSPATRGGTTLEDLVIEAIRPYLTEWMDKNLATIVKQLVEKEIKHLIPRDVE